MSTAINNSKVYSKHFSVDTWGETSEFIEQMMRDVRGLGFTVECKSQAIGERGFLFKKTVFNKDITISSASEKKLDIICDAVTSMIDMMVVGKL